MSEEKSGFPFGEEEKPEPKKETSRKAKGQQVKPGHQVLFVLDDSAHPGDVRPAIVVAKSGEHEVEEPDTEEAKEQEEELSRADLHVFASPKDYPTGHHRAGGHARHDVRYDEKKTPNSWHWPQD